MRTDKLAFTFFSSVCLLFAPQFLWAQVDLMQTNWAQPALSCVEDTVPEKPDRPCLDLSRVEDPIQDWPSNISDEELNYWKSRKRFLQYCRSREVTRREKADPGSQKPGTVQLAWMQQLAVEKREEKINAVYSASRKYKIPVQVLTGALYQESIFAELGIADDGGNFSCGAGQINVEEWCRWISEQTASKKADLGWPLEELACHQVSAAHVRPFYDRARRKLGGLPDYRLNASHFSNIRFNDVVNEFPSASAETQRFRYQAIRSFIDHCSESANGIAAKANELERLYKTFVPQGLKERELYPAGKRFERQCDQRGYDGAYPAHTGWILAVGIYNSGPRAVDALAHYNRWTSADLRDVKTFIGFTPIKLVESFYWAGRYNSKTDKIHFRTLKEADASWLWFKQCVLQRHAARVVQNVTMPNTPPLVESLEGEYKCTKSVFDPVTGDLVQSSVPPHRRSSSGMK